jgi:cAMP phosphodiesterase
MDSRERNYLSPEPKASYKYALFCDEVLTLNSKIPVTSIQVMQGINYILFHLNERITKSNSVDRVLLEKLTAIHLVQKLMAIYGTRFHIMPPRETRVWVTWIQAIFSYLICLRSYFHLRGARGSVVGSGTMLQAGRSRVKIPMRSFDFSVDFILPATLWPWDRLGL